MNKSRSKVSKFVEKLLDKRNVYGHAYILRLDYRVALLIIL